jgi:hypothetical protein
MTLYSEKQHTAIRPQKDTCPVHVNVNMCRYIVRVIFSRYRAPSYVERDDDSFDDLQNAPREEFDYLSYYCGWYFQQYGRPPTQKEFQAWHVWAMRQRQG